jgi:hypothetical protein
LGIARKLAAADQVAIVLRWLRERSRDLFTMRPWHDTHGQQCAVPSVTRVVSRRARQVTVYPRGSGTMCECVTAPGRIDREYGFDSALTLKRQYQTATLANGESSTKRVVPLTSFQ